MNKLIINCNIPKEYCSGSCTDCEYKTNMTYELPVVQRSGDIGYRDLPLCIQEKLLKEREELSGEDTLTALNYLTGTKGEVRYRLITSLMGMEALRVMTEEDAQKFMQKSEECGKFKRKERKF